MVRGAVFINTGDAKDCDLAPLKTDMAAYGVRDPELTCDIWCLWRFLCR